MQIRHWCKGEGLHPEYAIMVKGVAEDTTNKAIEETLQSIKVLGRVRVRGRIYDPKYGNLTVLCECKERINPQNIPVEVMPEGGEFPWRILASTMDEEEPPEQVTGTNGERDEEDPLSSFCTSTPEAIIRAVGDILQQQRKSNSDSNSFRRLRTFSGVIPTPPGEEPLDSWIEQVRLMVEECDRSNTEKRLKILESVKGPALEILQALRFNNPDATPNEYVDVLKNTFGSTDTGEDLFFAFRGLYQRPGETLSAFLRRMERVLIQVIQKGGLPRASADKVRLDQLIKGATKSNLMLLNLRLRERRDQPPTFLQLLNEIRSEEEYEASRHRLNPPKSVHVKTATVPTETNTMDIKTEIQELKTQVAKLTTLTSKQSSPQMAIKPAVITEAEGDDCDIQALKKEVRKLREQVSVMAVQPSLGTREFQPTRIPPRPSNTPSGQREQNNFFCYRCGEDGHVATKCSAPENYQKVIQKLIRAQRQQRTNSTSAPEAPPQDNPHHVSANRSAVEFHNSSLPEGLIGPSSTISIKVEGINCTALLDGGSQVTIVFQRWYEKHLSHIPLNPCSGLAVWGLSESANSYPYRGYIQVELEFPSEMPGSAGSIPVLALVCPDLRDSENLGILIGTNVPQARPFLSSQKAIKTDTVRALRVNTVNQSITPSTDAPSKARFGNTPVAEVRWPGPGPLVVPAGGNYIATCKVEGVRELKDTILITERAQSPALPPSVLVQPTVLFSKDMDKNKFLVLLRNESVKPTSIPKGTMLAHLQVADVVTEVQNPETARTQKIDPALFDFGDSPIPSPWKDCLKQKLSERSNVFSTSEWDLGLALGVEHRIRLSEDTPFRERSRRIAPADLEDLRRHLQGLLAAGIIKESRSPYASPIVLARKKSGQPRLCVDYRTLNQRTIPDQYTVPRIDDALDCLTGSKWFSVLDLRSGYYQIPMAAEDKEKTAFICPLGFYEFERMPQGITGAPATFQRLMERAVGDMHLLEVIVYLDDLIVFGRTLEEHEERLLKVLDRLEETGLKLSLDKCQFCQSKVTYVGHIVSEHGVATDPDKVKAVTQWKQPPDLPSLQSFLGFCGYYRRFIKNYSIIVRPLTELCKGYPPTQKKRRDTKAPDKTYHKVSQPFRERWGPECTEAFQKIIWCLTNAPVLAFADPAKPYVLHVDASFQGIGAVLNQEHVEGLRPVAFASRKLSVSERNYPVHQLEFLALKWAVVDKFHDYLYGANFTVRTDNNPLTYILTTAKLNATGHRWLAALSTYNFTLQYRPGNSNIDADSLSRNPLTDSDTEWQNISPESVKALCKATQGREKDGETSCWAESMGLSPEAVPECYAFLTKLSLGGLSQISQKEMSRAQDTDSVIALVKRAVKEGRPLNTVRGEDPKIALLRREDARLHVTDDVLYRGIERPPGIEISQLVLPQEFIPSVLRSLHDEAGHLGVDKTLELVRDRFYWPRMGAEVRDYVQSCGRCIARKTPPQKAAPLNQIVSNGPLDLVCIDFLSLEPDTQGYANILVVTDHYTRYAQAFPAKDQKALTVAKILCERFFVHYGLPARIHTDQGRDFESKLIHDLLKMLGIRKSRTTPYHPQGDPQPERFNRTLLSMLGTLDPNQKQKWSQSISQLVHAYNCTRNDATGYSPYLLMFGREARLPVDLCFGVRETKGSTETYLQYVAKLRTDLLKAYELATEAADKNHQRNKRAHDKMVKEQVLEEGDRVLLRNYGVPGKQKLKDKWRAMPYKVVGQMPNLPVYQVKPERGNGVIKTVHRNHLLPIGYLVRLPEPESDLEPPRRVETRSQQRAARDTAQSTRLRNASLSSDTDAEDDYSPTFTAPGWGKMLSSVQLHREPQSQIAGTDRVQSPEQDQPEDVLESPAEPILGEDLWQAVEPVLERDAVVTEGNTAEGGHPVEASKRVRKPVTRLTYNQLGTPLDQQVSVLSRGVWVGSGTYRDSRHQPCQTVWCHPMALCLRCGKFQANC